MHLKRYVEVLRLGKVIFQKIALISALWPLTHNSLLSLYSRTLFIPTFFKGTMIETTPNTARYADR